MIIFKREDLIEQAKELPIEQIGVEHYAGSISDIYSANIVMFIDGEQKKILKNRWGYEGIIGKEERNWKVNR